MATVRSTTLDSQPVPISRRQVWDRGNSGTHGRVVAWSSVSSASGREKWRNVWRRIGVHRSDGVGSDSPGSPWETSNNTLLAHDSLYSGTGPSLDPGLLLRTNSPQLPSTLTRYTRRVYTTVSRWSWTFLFPLLLLSLVGDNYCGNRGTLLYTWSIKIY